MKKVDIIILNYNGLEYTKKCLATLFKNTVYPYQIIVVDNCSTDGSVEHFKLLEKTNEINLIVHYSETLDSGYSAGINLGLKYSKNPYVLLLNNDIIFPKKGWLTKLVARLEAGKKRGIVSPKLLYPDGTIQYAGATFNPQLKTFHIGRHKNGHLFNKEREIPTATFACVLIKKELLKDGLDEAYLLGTFEDVDFCAKTRKAGYSIWYCPQVVLFHYESAAQFNRPMEHFSAQMKVNSELFGRRWNTWVAKDAKKHPKVYLP